MAELSRLIRKVCNTTCTDDLLVGENPGDHLLGSGIMAKPQIVNAAPHMPHTPVHTSLAVHTHTQSLAALQPLTKMLLVT